VAAHIFQLLMVAQTPIAGYFAITSVPRTMTSALRVLAVQIVAALAALAPVFFLDLQAATPSSGAGRSHADRDPS
jgi:hypothetical protein